MGAGRGMCLCLICASIRVLSTLQHVGSGCSFGVPLVCQSQCLIRCFFCKSPCMAHPLDTIRRSQLPVLTMHVLSC
jgi:hypothetical protein